MNKNIFSYEEFLKAIKILSASGESALSEELPTLLKAEEFLKNPIWNGEQAGLSWESAWCILAHLWSNAFPDQAYVTCPENPMLTMFHYCRWRGKDLRDFGLPSPPARVQEAAAMVNGGFDCGKCQSVCLRHPELITRVRDEAPLLRLVEYEALSLLAFLARCKKPGTATAMWIFFPSPVASSNGCLETFRGMVNLFFEEIKEPDARLTFFERFAEAMKTVADLMDKGDTLGLAEEFEIELSDTKLNWAAEIYKKLALAVFLCCGAARSIMAGNASERSVRGVALLKDVFTALFLCAAEVLGLVENAPYSVLANERFVPLFCSLFKDES